MSGLKPIIREAREAVMDAAHHMKDKLPRLAQNIDDHLDDVVRQVKAKDRFHDKPDLADKPVTHRPGEAGGPVAEFDTGSYKDLKARETVGDGLQHDHIPSSAAVTRARENELGRDLTRSERRALHNDAAAVELSDLLHSQSRTFRGRNTPSQIDLDAGDLRAAMERDLRTLKTNLTRDGRLSSEEISTLMQKIRDLNLKRGIG